MWSVPGGQFTACLQREVRRGASGVVSVVPLVFVLELGSALFGSDPGTA